MDIDKSLYMSDFLKMREELGKIAYNLPHSVLYSNIYDDFKKKPKKIKEIKEEIKDKNIIIQDKLKKEDKDILFPDLLSIDEEKKPEIKKIVLGSSNNNTSDSNIKTIMVDPESTISNEDKKKKK